ncbi:hypothetical protein MMC11_002639 [Xylographa trunciseda]|nr:hypothetical protein [Xylographa trunciseda]
MDFAPYQDTAPEHERALSPPPRRSSSRSPTPKSPPPNRPSTDPFSTSALPPPSHFGGAATAFGGADVEGGRPNVNLFETSLPIRLDYEAMLAYLLLPPAGGVLLLVMEHKSDYVRRTIIPDLHQPHPSSSSNAIHPARPHASAPTAHSTLPTPLSPKIAAAARMCHITSTPHPCGHTSTHLLMPCNAPKFPAPSSHDDYCTNPKVQYLTARQAVGYTCAICSKARRDSLLLAASAMAKAEAGEPRDGAEHGKRDSAMSMQMGKENVRVRGAKEAV